MKISSVLRTALVALVAFAGASLSQARADEGFVSLTIYKAGWIIGGSGGSGGSSSGSGSNSPSSSFGSPTSQQSTTAGISGTSGASQQSTSPVQPGAGPSTGGFIQADPSTNSLIITAPEALYRQLRAVIDQLDTTTLVPPGVKAEVDEWLNIRMEVS